MAVNGGHAGTKKGPNWGHVNERRVQTTANMKYNCTPLCAAPRSTLCRARHNPEPRSEVWWWNLRWISGGKWLWRFSPAKKKLENLLPNFAGSSPRISPKTSPTSLWKSLVLIYEWSWKTLLLQCLMRCNPRVSNGIDCIRTLGILGRVRAQAFFSRGASAISLKSRFLSAEFSVI